jgi:hypothetical protein
VGDYLNLIKSSRQGGSLPRRAACEQRLRAGGSDGLLITAPRPRGTRRPLRGFYPLVPRDALRHSFIDVSALGPHSEWGSEGALAGAKVCYVPQLKVEASVDAPQLGICCPTLHGAALDASWVQLDQT